MSRTVDALSGLETFVQVVESGNFALAAERLRMTRSAVGKTIARLEAQLGVRLFHRTTRKQALTDDGQTYYAYCVRALAELDAGKLHLASGRQAPSGRLRVSAPTEFGRACVAPTLLRLAQRHPALSLEMSFSDRVVDLVEEGIDLAVRVGPLPDSATLAARRLGGQRVSVYASPQYLAAHGRPATLEDLAQHPCIAYSRGGWDYPWSFELPDGSTCTIQPTARIRLDNLQAMADAAVASAGVAWLPDWLVKPHVDAGRLEPALPHVLGQLGDIHAVWPKSRHLAAKTRAAIDALVEDATGAGWWG